MRRNVHTVVMCLNPVPYAPSAQTASSRRRTRESRVKNVKCVVPSGNSSGPPPSRPEDPERIMESERELDR